MCIRDSVCSVLNKERIQGFCLCSLNNLRDTRCVTVKGATLEDYVAHVAPRVGVNLSRAWLEIEQCQRAASHTVEGVQQSMVRLNYMVRNSYEMLECLPCSLEVQTLRSELDGSALALEQLTLKARQVLLWAAEIRRLYPGSGAPSNIVRHLRGFTERLGAPNPKAAEGIATAIGQLVLGEE
eukprot:TRINITY_DN19850_c0_g1_i1.p1 TRINITY_DN19850_c0_g1~~TRINITY_DN19850_c0_g1_i1.p1  ORF type:complete len:182 (+),score=63.18 TRINITY_DN19850_c0_g1_i1:192-737(+)